MASKWFIWYFSGDPFLVGGHWGVWASDDGGDSWALQFRFRNGAVGGPMTNFMGRNLISHGNRLYAATSDDYGGFQNRLRYSDDDGANWHIAWSISSPPWDEAAGEDEVSNWFFGFTLLTIGDEVFGIFQRRLGKATDPTDLESWEHITIYDCPVSNEQIAYTLDSRTWFESNGSLREYVPGAH